MDVDGKRPIGRPRKTSEQVVRKDTRVRKLSKPLRRWLWTDLARERRYDDKMAMSPYVLYKMPNE